MISRLSSLKREQTRQVQHQNNVAWYSFVARPTCPTSTSMSVLGGTCKENKSSYNLDDIGRLRGLAWTVPNIVRDLTDNTQARVDMGYDSSTKNYVELMWTQSGWYRGGVLLLLLPDTEENPTDGDWRLRLSCFQEECATPGEAESRLMAWFDETDPLDPTWNGNYWPNPVRRPIPGTDYRESGMPLCGIILRNNDTLGEGRFFMPIDILNRGQSYTWPRDLRPQWVGL